MVLPPSPDFYSFTYIHHEVQKLLQIIGTGSYTLESLQTILSRQSDYHQQQITCKLILNILQKYSREDKIHPFDEDVIFQFLELVPNASKVKDSEGLLLIHHFAIMEDPSIFLMKRLIDNYPASCSEYALFGYVEATPLHLLLLKNAPNFQLATYMIDAYPSSVK